MASAYGVEYRVEIGCVAGTAGATETYRLDIEQKGNDGLSVVELTSGSNPIEFSYPGGAHPFAPLKPSMLTVTIVTADDAQADTLAADFKTFDDQEYQVKLYNNLSQLRWTGWLVSDDGYEEDYATPSPREIRLKAIDGVGLLQKKEFRTDPTDPDSALRTGRASAHSIIQEALEAYWPDTTAGNFLTYAMLKHVDDGGDTWTNHTSPTDAKNPLKLQFWDQTYFMVDRARIPMTWFDVLRIILRNNFMFMTNGMHEHAWPTLVCYLRYLTTASGEDLVVLNYDNLDGSYNSVQNEMFTTTLNDTSGTEIDNIFRGVKRTHGKPVKHVDVTRVRTDPNLIVGGNFEDESWTNATTLDVSWYEGIGNGASNVSKTAETLTHSSSSLAFSTTTADKGNPNGIRCLKGKTTSLPTSKIGFSFKFNITVSDSFPSATHQTPPELGVAFMCGGRYLQDDLTSWEADSTAANNIIWMKIPADQINTGWQTQSLCFVSAPDPGGEVYFECYAPVENDYTITAFKYDEFYALEYLIDNTAPAGVVTYTDQESTATNADLTDEFGRFPLELNVGEFPKVVVRDISSAVFDTITYDFNNTYNNDAAFTIVLDGSGKTYTYKTGGENIPLGQWYGVDGASRMTSLIKCIFYDTGNYLVTSADGAAGKELTITALQYGDELSHSSYGGTAVADGWNETETTHVAPDDVNFVSKACLTDDASATTVYSPKFYFNGDSSPSTFEFDHWKVIAKKYLEALAEPKEKIEGALMVFNESTDHFGPICGIDVDGTEYMYFFLGGECSLKQLTWDGRWMKMKSTSISSVSYGTVIPPDTNYFVVRPQVRGFQLSDFGRVFGTTGDIVYPGGD